MTPTDKLREQIINMITGCSIHDAGARADAIMALPEIKAALTPGEQPSGNVRRWRKKPVVLEAFKLGVDSIPDWFMDKVSTNEIILHGAYRELDNADIHTLEGVMRADKGDYVIRGVKGEIYPCKPDIFAELYEPEAALAGPSASAPDRFNEGVEAAVEEWVRCIKDKVDHDAPTVLVRMRSMKPAQPAPEPLRCTCGAIPPCPIEQPTAAPATGNGGMND